MMVLSTVIGHLANAQRQKTPYFVGYTDTTLFTTENYQFGNYDGPAPLFVQVWHPIRYKPTSRPLTFGQLHNEQLSGPLAQVYQQLESYSDSAFIEYNLLYTIDTEEEIGYDGHTPADLLEEAKLIPACAYRSKLTGEGKFPVVLYHHGSQSTSDDNYRMAEYFASRGYIFIAANFHLPLEGRSYGSIPWESSYFDTTAVSTLMQFANTLAGEQPVFAIGHSWGAQVLWHYLKDNSTVEGFISLETTLEFKADTLKVKEYWPELYQTLLSGKGHYHMPVLLMAAMENDQPFPWFEGCSDHQMYCSPKTTFHHDSYTSTFFSRYFMREHLPQPDEAELERQYLLYQQQLEIAFQFMEATRKHRSWRTTKFRSHFYLSYDRN